MRLFGERLLGQLRQMGDAGVCDQSELRQMRAQRIGRHGALAQEQGPGAVVMRMACCSTALTGTNRIVGRRTASQIASASSASLLPRLGREPINGLGLANAGRPVSVGERTLAFHHSALVTSPVRL